MADNILEVKGLSKVFPGVHALSDVSFEVKRGTVHTLVGENGAGKSTLIKIITGVYQPTAGTFIFNGKPANIKEPLDAIRMGISVVHQEIKLVETLSIAENIFLGRSITGKAGLVSWKKMNKQAQQFVDELNIKLDVTQEVSKLSIAQKQIVEICKALSLNAELMIMDEPTATLTDNELERLFSIIETLKRRGITIVFISHRMEEIFRIADYVTVLRDGTHVCTLPISQVNRKQLISKMVGREIGEEYPKSYCPIGEVALSVENLTRRGVIQDVSFDVHHGEILGFAGLVGSGRTETVRCIFAADKPTAGRIKINGREVHIHDISSAIKHKLAFIPEDRKQQGLVLGMNVSNNISMVDLDLICTKGVISEKKEKGQASRMVELLHIATPSIEQICSNLSGGNQQKVVLAKWMAVDSDIIIFDEPTRGIDVGAKAEIYRLICSLASKGKAIIMISSDMPELIGICDRILVMREGRVSGIVDRNEFDQERILDLAVL